MNEPVEYAYTRIAGEPPVALDLKRTVKFGRDSLYMHGDATQGRASYSDSYLWTITAVRESNEGDAKKKETCTHVFPGWVSNGHTSTREVIVPKDPESPPWMRYTESYRPLRGYWDLGIVCRERLLDILEELPANARVAFHLYLDAGTNELCVRSDCKMHYYQEQGLHVDHLYLCASYLSRGKERKPRFLIDVSVCAHNSARFGNAR